MATSPMLRPRPAVQVQPASRMRRGIRSPEHQWAIRQEAWQMQSICIAPVLPGETLKNALFQAMVVSDPVASKLVGWWCEYYWFYVKLRDIEVSEGHTDYTSMLLSQTEDLTAYESAGASLPNYHPAGEVNWVGRARAVVLEKWFRDQGEASGDHAIGGVESAAAYPHRSSWLDSVQEQSTFESVDVNVDLDTDTNVMASEVMKAMQMYEMARSLELTEMSYEDFLKSYGVRIAAVETHTPELLRYVRSFDYPVSHVDPTDGSPTSAMVWRVRERIDKDRFFKEPGFICGYCVVRPKVFRKNQTGSMSHTLRRALNWLPATLVSETTHMWQEFAAGTGPLPSVTNAYIADVKDLFLYGDQYVNFALSATDHNLVALPTAALEKEYAADADADGLWVDAVGGNNLVRQDGVIRFAIATRQQDTSPSVGSTG